MQVRPENFLDFRCVILPGSCPPSFMHRAEYELVYRQWRRIWKRVMSHLTGEGTYDADNFFKQDFITAVLMDQEVVGHICSRFLDLNSAVTADLGYFQNFLGNAKDALRERGARFLLTLEWNAINPSFSRRRSGVPFVEIMFHLCVKLAKAIGVDCCTAVPRKITKVQDVLAAMNFVTTDRELLQYRCPIDIMLGFVEDVPRHPDDSVQELIEFLWNGRSDRTGLTSQVLTRSRSAVFPKLITHSEDLQE